MLGKYDEAVAFFNEVIRLNPESVGGICDDKGRALARLGMGDEAIACLDQAFAMRPDTEVLNGTSEVYPAPKMDTEPVGGYNQDLMIRPDTADDLNSKGVALAGHERYEEALVYFEKDLNTNPDNAVVWNNKGVALACLERYEEAVSCYDRSLQIDPHNVTVLVNKGRALAKLKRHNEAVACFDAVLSINPDTAGSLIDEAAGIQARNRAEDVARVRSGAHRRNGGCLPER